MVLFKLLHYDELLADFDYYKLKKPSLKVSMAFFEIIY
jgi:hypothetical protein